MKMLARFVLLAGLAPAAYSQSVLYTFDGDSPGDRFGSSVSGAGDVNGDGYDDMIVGIGWDDNNGEQSGSARVFSGADGSILFTLVGDSSNDFFGYSVSGAGDVNRDGFSDFIVGMPSAANNGKKSGSARVFSGLDGSVLYTFDGDSKKDHFGWSVSGAGDVNGDGFADLIVGAPYDGPMDRGGAWVFSGADGSVLHVFHGTPQDWFGYSVSGAGDVDGDGFDDLIVGAHLANHRGQEDRGRVQVFSGISGTVLHTFHGDILGGWLGYSVSGAGDVNGDGFDDVIAGAPRASYARVFSGVDGSILHFFDSDPSGKWFGGSVSGAGDVNGDGFDDLIVGADFDDHNGVEPGSAGVYSGLDGSVLYILDGELLDDRFGVSVSGAGDVNGDGYDDLIVGAWYDDNNGENSGSARVLSGCDVLGSNYCTPAVPNSSGQSAVISACGSDLADGGYFMLHATDLPINKFGYFLASETQDFVATPPGSQGNLCLGGKIDRFVKQVLRSDTDGSFSLTVLRWAMPGDTWNFQAWFRDNNPGKTSNFTDAVSVLFQ